MKKIKILTTITGSLGYALLFHESWQIAIGVALVVTSAIIYNWE